MSAKVFVLIPAAGSGQRVGGAIPKQYQTLGEQFDQNGESMLARTLAPFFSTSGIDRVIVLVQADDPHIAQAVKIFPQVQVMRCGASTRAGTVYQALGALADELTELDWVAVHDAARPGLHVADWQRLQAALVNDSVGGLLALPIVDTVKRARAQEHDPMPCVATTLDRSDLWLAQTPQMFRYGVLRRALAAVAPGFVGITDEASAIENIGFTPRLVMGNRLNFKVTDGADLALARRLFGIKPSPAAE